VKPIEEAAQLLIRTFGRPAKHHAVWIRTELGDDNREDATVIMVAVHPGSVSSFPPIPSEFMGVPVRQVPWQPDDVRDHEDWHQLIAETARGAA